MQTNGTKTASVYCSPASAYAQTRGAVCSPASAYAQTRSAVCSTQGAYFSTQGAYSQTRGAYLACCPHPPTPLSRKRARGERAAPLSHPVEEGWG